MKLLIIFLCAFSAAQALSVSENLESWKNFKLTFSQNYSSYIDEAKAYDYYVVNVANIEKSVALFLAGNTTFKLAVNQFSNIPFVEFAATYLTLVVPASAKYSSSSTAMRALPAPAMTSYPNGPAAVDFRYRMLPVVNQQSCGSCWAFATMAVMESFYKRLNPAYNTPLSQQYLVDCNFNLAPNQGCNGGWPTVAFDYLKANGTVSALNYPYKSADGVCKSKPKMQAIINEVVQYLPYGNETLLKNIVASEGPVVVAIQVINSFYQYGSGIYYDATCPSACDAVNHAVVVVGYGTDSTYNPPKDYWIVRNSWSSTWGQNGHIRMARNAGNNCNIACYAMYAK